MIQYISTLVGGTLEGDLSSLTLPIRDETLLIQCVSESESESENVHLTFRTSLSQWSIKDDEAVIVHT